MDRFSGELPPITLIAGDSGTGKSTLLRAVCAALSRRGRAVIDVASLGESPGRPLAEFGDMPLRLWLRTLARAGLGEARLLGRTLEQLSVGERHRFRIAAAMSRAMQRAGSVVVIDEFVSPLDRATAESVSRGVRRWAHAVASKSGVRLIVASAHEDLPGFLSPCRVVRCGPRGGVSVENPGGEGSHEDADAPLRIERGGMADYRPLGACHYLAGPPATVAGVWRAVRPTPHGDRLAGVLVASYPTLNGRWRQLAWPGDYVGASPGHKRLAAVGLNRDVRCLSRVIVEPPSRGMGVARRLVRHYLREPLTRRTESVAAMGAMSPFFQRAGMTPWEMGARGVDTRFERVLERAGLSPIDVLSRGEAAAREVLGSARVERGLRVWVNATADARRGRANGAKSSELLMGAACRLVASPVAYTAEKQSDRSGDR